MIDVDRTFRENEILLTGATGFLGKVVLGMLVDRYPDFKHIHVLLRAAGGLTPAGRLERETLGSPALRAITARARGERRLGGKISVWAGDVGLPGCGLAPRDRDRLAGRVTLIINCAGLVDFFPPLDASFRSNVDGVEQLIVLARRLGARLLHVSTCFVCGQADGLVEESEPILGFYPHRKGPDDHSFSDSRELAYCRHRIAEIYRSASSNGNLAELVARPPRELARHLAVFGRQRAEHWGWVNTYTYAKSLGEQRLAAEPALDWTIVRPAIVESALQFPFPGWIEGGRTAAPLVLMALSGMKEWPVRRDAPLEVVPVDQVAAAILAVGALLLHGRHRAVYQLGTADVNPIRLGPLVKLLDAEARQSGRPPSARLSRAIVGRLVGAAARRGPVRFLSAAEAQSRRVRLQKRIARVQDLVTGLQGLLETARLPGRGTLAEWTAALRTLGLQTSFREHTLEQYLPFILHNRFVFECENIRAAYALLSPEDRARLPWEPEKIDWVRYWADNQIRGIQKWVQPRAVREWSFRI